MGRQITVRGVSEELARRLRSRARDEGASLNTTVNRVLEQGVGLDERAEKLGRYATWSQEDLDQFARSLREQRQVDDEMWR